MAKLSTWLLLSGCLIVMGCAPVDRSSQDGEPQRGVTTSEPARPWPKATQVRLMVQDKGYGADGQPLFSNPAGRVLTPAERARFEGALARVTVVKRPSADESAATATAACFIPHHFFQYLDARGRQLGEVQVCFCCGGAQARPSRPIYRFPDSYLQADMPAIKGFVAGLGLPTDVECD